MLDAIYWKQRAPRNRYLAGLQTLTKTNYTNEPGQTDRVLTSYKYRKNSGIKA
jgi:hypothetical protein